MNAKDLLNLYFAGETLQSIGQKYGVSGERIRQKLLPYKEEINKFFQEKKVRAVDLLKQNLSIKDIAKILKLGPNTIVRLRKENAININRYIEIENVYGKKIKILKKKQGIYEAIIKKIKEKKCRKDIASELGISIRTLDSYITIYKLSPRKKIKGIVMKLQEKLNRVSEKLFELQRKIDSGRHSGSDVQERDQLLVEYKKLEEIKEEDAKHAPQEIKSKNN